MNKQQQLLILLASLCFSLANPLASLRADEIRGIVILVHGVNADKSAYESFNIKIAQHLPDVKIIEFDWGKESFFKASDSVGGRANSYFGMSDQAFVAAAKLKDVVAQCSELVGEDVPINILAHSQGSIVTLSALQEGMKVNNWIIMGSPLDKEIVSSGQLNTSLGSAAKNVSGDVVSLWSSEDHVAQIKGGIGRFGLPRRIHGVAGSVSNHKIENIYDQFVSSVDHFGDEGWWAMDWLSPMDPVVGRKWTGVKSRESLTGILSGLASSVQVDETVLSAIQQFASEGTRKTALPADWGRIYGDSATDEFEYTFTLTQGMINGIYFDDKDDVNFELNCTQGKVEYIVQSATGSEWDQKTSPKSLNAPNSRSGFYNVDNLISDATVFLRVRATTPGTTKVKVKLSARNTTGVEVLDVDIDGKLYSRKLTADETSFIQKQDRSSIKGLIDGEVSNKSSEPILVYGPKPNRLHRNANVNAIYLLRPGQQTIESWDFDGVFVPADRKANGTSGPFAAEITNDEFCTVDQVDSTKYDISVNFGLGAFDVVPNNANWVVPPLNQAQIEQLADGDRLDVAIQLTNPPTSIPDVMEIIGSLAPESPVNAKVLASDADLELFVFDHSTKTRIKPEAIGGVFPLVASLPKLEDLPVEYSVTLNQGGQPKYFGVLSVRRDGQSVVHELEFVKQGLYTFMAQGRSDRTLQLRHPRFRGMKDEDNKSGVLIGRGYNLRSRTAAQVMEETKDIGMNEVRSTLAQAAGLSRLRAAQFCREYSDLRISRVSQVKLFNRIYSLGAQWNESVGSAQVSGSVDSYIDQARKNYEFWTSKSEYEHQRTSWDSLHPAIQEVLVDFVFQGFTKGPRPMLKGMRNNFEELINYIETNSTMKSYEPGRQRASYLRFHQDKLGAENSANRPHEIASWRVEPNDVVGLTLTNGVVVRSGRVAVTGKLKSEDGQGEFKLSFRRKLKSGKWTDWVVNPNVQYQAAQKALNATVPLLPSSNYQIRLEVLSTQNALVRESIKTINVATQDGYSGDLIPLDLEGLNFSLPESEFIESPQLRITKVIYGSGAGQQEFQINDAEVVKLEGGDANKTEDDIGYLIRRNVNSKPEYHFSPGVASVAIPGDQENSIGFQGVIGFVVEQSFKDPDTGNPTTQTLEPDGDSSPTFSIKVNAGATRNISKLSDQNDGWKQGSFSLAAAETQHRLRYLGKRNGQVAWLEVDGQVEAPASDATKLALSKFREATTGAAPANPINEPNDSDIAFLTPSIVSRKTPPSTPKTVDASVLSKLDAQLTLLKGKLPDLLNASVGTDSLIEAINGKIGSHHIEIDLGKVEEIRNKLRDEVVNAIADSQLKMSGAANYAELLRTGLVELDNSTNELVVRLPCFATSESNGVFSFESVGSYVGSENSAVLGDEELIKQQGDIDLVFQAPVDLDLNFDAHLESRVKLSSPHASRFIVRNANLSVKSYVHDSKTHASAFKYGLIRIGQPYVDRLDLQTIFPIVKPSRDVTFTTSNLTLSDDAARAKFIQNVADRISNPKIGSILQESTNSFSRAPTKFAHARVDLGDSETLDEHHLAFDGITGIENQGEALFDLFVHPAVNRSPRTRLRAFKLDSLKTAQSDLDGQVFPLLLNRVLYLHNNGSAKIFPVEPGKRWRVGPDADNLFSVELKFDSVANPSEIVVFGAEPTGSKTYAILSPSRNENFGLEFLQKEGIRSSILSSMLDYLAKYVQDRIRFTKKRVPFTDRSIAEAIGVRTQFATDIIPRLFFKRIYGDPISLGDSLAARIAKVKSLPLSFKLQVDGKPIQVIVPSNLMPIGNEEPQPEVVYLNNLNRVIDASLKPEGFEGAIYFGLKPIQAGKAVEFYLNINRQVHAKSVRIGAIPELGIEYLTRRAELPVSAQIYDEFSFEVLDDQGETHLVEVPKSDDSIPEFRIGEINEQLFANAAIKDLSFGFVDGMAVAKTKLANIPSIASLSLRDSSVLGFPLGTSDLMEVNDFEPLTLQLVQKVFKELDELSSLGVAIDIGKKSVNLSLRDVGIRHEEEFNFGKFDRQALKQSGFDNLRLSGDIKARVESTANVEFGLNLGDVHLPDPISDDTRLVDLLKLNDVASGRSTIANEEVTDWQAASKIEELADVDNSKFFVVVELTDKTREGIPSQDRNLKIPLDGIETFGELRNQVSKFTSGRIRLGLNSTKTGLILTETQRVKDETYSEENTRTFRVSVGGYGLLKDSPSGYAYKGRVKNEVSLTTTGHAAGDVYKSAVTNKLFVWDGDSWEAVRWDSGGLIGLRLGVTGSDLDVDGVIEGRDLIAKTEMEARFALDSLASLRSEASIHANVESGNVDLGLLELQAKGDGGIQAEFEIDFFTNFEDTDFEPNLDVESFFNVGLNANRTKQNFSGILWPNEFGDDLDRAVDELNQNVKLQFEWSWGGGQEPGKSFAKVPEDLLVNELAIGGLFDRNRILGYYDRTLKRHIKGDFEKGLERINELVDRFARFEKFEKHKIPGTNFRLGELIQIDEEIQRLINIVSSQLQSVDLTSNEQKVKYLAQLHDIIKVAVSEFGYVDVQFDPDTQSFLFVIRRKESDLKKCNLNAVYDQNGPFKNMAFINVGDRGRASVGWYADLSVGIGIDLRPKPDGDGIRGVYLSCPKTFVRSAAKIEIPTGDIEVVLGPFKYKIGGLKIKDYPDGIWEQDFDFQLPELDDQSTDNYVPGRVYEFGNLASLSLDLPDIDFELDFSGIRFPDVPTINGLPDFPDFDVAKNLKNLGINWDRLNLDLNLNLKKVFDGIDFPVIGGGGKFEILDIFDGLSGAFEGDWLDLDGISVELTEINLPTLDPKLKKKIKELIEKQIERSIKDTLSGVDPGLEVRRVDVNLDDLSVRFDIQFQKVKTTSRELDLGLDGIGFEMSPKPLVTTKTRMFFGGEGACDGTLDPNNTKDYATVGFDKNGVWFWDAHVYCTASAEIDPPSGGTADRDFITDLGFLRFDTKLKSIQPSQAPDINCFSIPIDSADINGLSLKTVVTLANKVVDETAPVGQRKERTRINELISNISNSKSINKDDATLEGVGFGLIANAGFHASSLSSQQLDFLPRFRTSFDFQWGMSYPNNPEQQKQDLVRFGKIEMNVGEFATKFLDPIHKEVEKVTKPVTEIVETCETPLPVISELGGNITIFDLALLLVEEPEDAESIKDIREAIKNLSEMNDRIAKIKNLVPNSNNGWIEVGAFDLSMSDARSPEAKGNLQPDKSSPDLQKIIAAGLEKLSQVEGTELKTRSLFAGIEDIERRYLKENAGRFSFPIVETIHGYRKEADGSVKKFVVSSPQDVIFGMLLGQDASLFEYRVPRLRASFEYSQFFPIIGPLGARIGGRASAEATVAIGYDTSAIRQHRKVQHGFYLNDRLYPGGKGPDILEAAIRMGLYAAAEINVAVARAGVEGGLFGEIGLDLNDCDASHYPGLEGNYFANDGKVYLEEIEKAFETDPLKLFNVKATLYAQLRAYIEIGFKVAGKFKCIFCKEKLFPRVILFDGELFGGCESASIERNSRSQFVWLKQLSPINFTSLLFSQPRQDESPYSADRILVCDVSHPKVEFRFAEGRYEGGNYVPPLLTQHVYDSVDSQVSKNPIPHWNLKFESDPTKPQSTVIVNGSNNVDHIIVGPNVPFNLQINGNGGDDVIINNGIGKNVKINGGGGNDEITGSNEVGELLIGGDGEDTILGRGGDDWIYGFGIAGDPATGDADKLLDGGRGNDHIFGGPGSDVKLTGGQGDDWIWGGAGDDNIVGESGNDQLVGGAGSDTVGDPEKEIGNDVLVATSSSELAELDFAQHPLSKDKSKDATAEENAAIEKERKSLARLLAEALRKNNEFNLNVRRSDWLKTKNWGDTKDPDSLDRFPRMVQESVSDDGEDNQDTKKDVLNGGPSHDFLIGSKGKDELSGNSGNDWVWGADGNDEIAGGSGNDFLFGNDGVDKIAGETGADALVGGLGSDFLYAGKLPDKLPERPESVVGSVPLYESLNPVHIKDFLTPADDDIGRHEIYGGDILWSDERLPQADDGNDLIVGSNGANLVIAGSGNNTVWTGKGTDSIFTGARRLHRTPFELEQNNQVVNELIESPTVVPSLLVVKRLDGFTNRIHAGIGSNEVHGANGVNKIWMVGSDVTATVLDENYVGELNVITTGIGDDQITSIHNAKDFLPLESIKQRISSPRGPPEDNSDQFETWYESSLSDNRHASHCMIDTGAGQDLVVSGNGRDWIETLGDYGHLIAPSGQAISDGETFSFNGETYEFEKDRPAIAANPVLIEDSSTIKEVALAIATTLEKMGLTAVAVDARVHCIGEFDASGTPQLTVAMAEADDTRDVIFVGEGINTVNADGGDNYVQASATNSAYNIIIATTGDDVIRAGNQNDFILTGKGNDIVFGGEGDDIIVAGRKPSEILPDDNDEDVVHGQGGNDIIIGGARNDILNGGKGRDILIGGQPNDGLLDFDAKAIEEFYALAKKLHKNGGGPTDRKSFEEFYRNIFSKFEGSLMFPDEFKRAEIDSAQRMGRSYEYSERYPKNFPSHVAARSVNGEPGDGNDRLIGGEGDDWLFGGAESDWLFGGNGNDYLDGGTGGDELYGNWPSNQKAANANFDETHGFVFETTVKVPVVGGEAERRIRDYEKIEVNKTAGTNDDVLRGGFNDDILKGGWGIDQLFGEEHDDLLFGDQGLETKQVLPVTEQQLKSLGSDLMDVPDWLLVALQSINISLQDGALVCQVKSEKEEEQEPSDRVWHWIVYDTNGYRLIALTALESTVASYPQFGQRLWGGSGVDILHGYSSVKDKQYDGLRRRLIGETRKPLPATDYPVGDDLRGGGGGDFLYGSLRRDLIIGDSLNQPAAGNDYLHGDYLKDGYKLNYDAGWSGGADKLYGNRGSDQLYGGGGDDELWGGQDNDCEVDPNIWTTGGRLLDRDSRAFCLACSVDLGWRLAI